MSRCTCEYLRNYCPASVFVLETHTNPERSGYPIIRSNKTLYLYNEENTFSYELSFISENYFSKKELYSIMCKNDFCKGEIISQIELEQLILLKKFSNDFQRDFQAWLEALPLL